MLYLGGGLVFDESVVKIMSKHVLAVQITVKDREDVHVSFYHYSVFSRWEGAQ